MRKAIATIACLWTCVSATSAFACSSSHLRMRVDGLPACVTLLNGCVRFDCESDDGYPHDVSDGYVRLENGCEDPLILEELECGHCDVAVPRTEPGQIGGFVVDTRWVGDVPSDDTPSVVTLTWDLANEGGTIIVALQPEVNECYEGPLPEVSVDVDAGDSEPTVPDGGCSTAGAAGEPLFAMLAFWARRRRRRAP